jgi:hypothetical protein
VPWLAEPLPEATSSREPTGQRHGRNSWVEGWEVRARTQQRNARKRQPAKLGCKFAAQGVGRILSPEGVALDPELQVYRMLTDCMSHDFLTLHILDRNLGIV